MDELLKPGSAASDFIRQHGSDAKREAMKEVLRARRSANSETEAYYRHIFEEIMAFEDAIRKLYSFAKRDPKQ